MILTSWNHPTTELSLPQVLEQPVMYNRLHLLASKEKFRYPSKTIGCLRPF